jgi:integrase
MFHGPRAKSEAKAWAETKRAQLVVGGKESDEVEVPHAAPRSTRAIGDLLLERMAEEGLSPGHIYHMKRMLLPVARLVPDLAAPEASGILREWLNRGLAAVSYNRNLNQLRKLVTWSKDEGYLPATLDPLGPIKPRRVAKKLKTQFTLEQYRHLLCQGDDHYHLAFALLVYTGARISEALTIHWEDIEWDGLGGGVIVFRMRAGRKLKTGEGITPLAPELARLLEPIKKKSGPIIALSSMNANTRFNAFLAAHGLQDLGLTPHSCRHSYIGLMTATGEAAGVVRQWVRHKTEAMTFHYAEGAARYRTQVADWKRGQMQIMEGVTSPWPRADVAGKESMRRKLRASAA